MPTFTRNISGDSNDFTGLRSPATLHPDNSVTPQVEAVTTQNAFRETFAGSTISTDNWVVTTVGTGMTGTALNGTMAISTGTTALDEYVLTSVQSYSVPIRLLVSSQWSQRIANQQFAIEIISVDPVTGVEDALNAATWRVDGTSATTAIYEVQESGTTRLVSTASTIATTAAQSLFEIEARQADVWFHSGVTDSTVGRAASYRRITQMPDPNARYKLRIRAKNTATAASTTTMTISLVGLVEHHEQATEITSARGGTAAGQAMPVAVTGTVAMPTGTSANPVQGVAAANATIANAGSPVVGAGLASSANPTVATAGRTVVPHLDLYGAAVTRPHALHESMWQFACAAVVANTTALALKTAAAAGIRNYVTTVSYQNTNATATEVQLLDGATVIWRGYAAASMAVPAVVAFACPLKGTAATALNFANVTTGAAVYVNASGFIGQ